MEAKPVTPTEVIILIEALFPLDLEASWRGFCNLHLLNFVLDAAFTSISEEISKQTEL